MDTTARHQALAAAIRQRLVIIADRQAYHDDPEGHLDRLKQVSQTIDEQSAQLPQPVDPELAHYLQRCSYDKALSYLEGKFGTAP